MGRVTVGVWVSRLGCAGVGWDGICGEMDWVGDGAGWAVCGHFRMAVSQEAYVAIVYDPACACEPLTRPEIRIGALRNGGNHVQMMVKGALGRLAPADSPDHVREGDAVSSGTRSATGTRRR